MIEKTEIVEQQAFYVSGISIRTINHDGQSKKDMMALWARFMDGNILQQFKGLASEDIYCVYTDYESDYTGYYTAVLGRKVASLTQIPEGFTAIAIPAGKYKIYNLSGKCPQNVLDGWQHIWDSGTDRKYSADFDVYTPNVLSFDDSDVKIYLAIK